MVKGLDKYTVYFGSDSDHPVPSDLDDKTKNIIEFIT